jgi:LuxR family transcriptional regulator, maltose regulon positive regulatory protein
MVDIDVRQHAGLAHRGGPAFDLVTSKLQRPPFRPGAIRRSSLIERLARDDSRPVVSVVAPAGYGKTTLLSQWAERPGEAFAWVSVDEADNDPKVLLTYVAEALNAVEPVSERVFDALASPASSVPGSVVPRLGAAFSAMTSPVVLVLDDVHLLHNPECRVALSVLADHVPGGSRLVFAGRSEPPVRVARLRAEGKILEVGPGELSLTRGEAAGLLRAAQVALGADEVAELHRRTEGWPTGLYLAALCLKEGGSPGSAAFAFGGDHRFVSGYVESELLARLSPRQRVFLTQSAVLERMSGPLCEAVLDLPEPSATLADLARSNLLLVPLDQRGQWYRYHHLFRDVLLARLHRQDRGLVPVLRRRAAGWFLRNDQPEAALEYFIAAGDVDEAAGLVNRLWLPTDWQRRLTTVQRWFRWLEDRGGIARHPMLAVQAAFIAATTGRPADAERWADLVDRWQYQHGAHPEDPDAEAWALVLRASLCRHGAEQMRADADDAARRFAAENIVAPVAPLLQGVARVLRGDLEGGDLFLEDAASADQEKFSPDTLAVVACERSLVAMTRGDWNQAEALAGQAGILLRQAGIEDSYATPLVAAVLARTAWRRGDAPAVRQHLVRAQRLRHLLTYAVPHVAVQARIELIRVHAALGDLAGAQILMREIDEVLKRRPGLGTLVDQAGALRAQLAQQRVSSVPGASALTAAELRLLPLLSTHLPVPDIAAELFLSPHTIKSQMKSIYRKLDATTRNQAVIRARELGLLEG